MCIVCAPVWAPIVAACEFILNALVAIGGFFAAVAALCFCCHQMRKVKKVVESMQSQAGPRQTTESFAEV